MSEEVDVAPHPSVAALEALDLYARGFRGVSNRHYLVGRDPLHGTPRQARDWGAADYRRHMVGEGANKLAVTAEVYRELKALEKKFG